MHEEIAAAISAATNRSFGRFVSTTVAGGCINQTAEIADGSQRYFLKLNHPSFLENFDAESDALARLAETRTVRVPTPVCHGTTQTHAYLVLEHLDLAGSATAGLGSALAGLHRSTSSTGQFGWHRDNTIGATLQSNPWTASWAEFFTRHRLAHQLDIAAANGHRFTGTAPLLDLVRATLESHSPPPSLLHGDLWSGNAATTSDGTPVLFDPACYYGDRETDIAFTHMFGGFGSGFYDGYQQAFPLPSGHRARQPIYNLYHLLNHHNLFGGHYTAEAQRSIDSIVGDLG